MFYRMLTAGGAAFLAAALSACVSADAFQKERTEMNGRMTALQAEVVRNATLLEETRKEFRAFQAGAEAEKRKRDLVRREENGFAAKKRPAHPHPEKPRESGI